MRSHTGGFLEGAREMTGRESARQALASRERSRRWPWSELAYGKAASVGGLFIPNVTRWPIASFRGAAEFGRHRGIADIEQDAPQFRPMRTHPQQTRVDYSATATTDFLAADILNKRRRAVPAFPHALQSTEKPIRMVALTPAVLVLIVGLKGADKIGHAGSIPIAGHSRNLSIGRGPAPLPKPH